MQDWEYIEAYPFTSLDNKPRESYVFPRLNKPQVKRDDGELSKPQSASFYAAKQAGINEDDYRAVLETRLFEQKKNRDRRADDTEAILDSCR